MSTGAALRVAIASASGRYGARGGTPNGLSIVSVSLIAPGENAGFRLASTVPATISTGSQRQRGEGRCPSGKMDGTAAATMITGGTNSTSAAHARNGVAGHVPSARAMLASP